VDVRPDAAKGTLPGAITVPLGKSFSSWAGSVVASDEPFFVIESNRDQADDTARALALIGRVQAGGWVSPQSLAAYREAGGDVESIASVADVPSGRTIVDVRTSTEWRAGHIDGATHMPLARLPEKLGALDPSAPVLVYCQAGVRSLVAASTLRRKGFSNVTSLEGGNAAYKDRKPSATTV
jgi:hydroxyacylglutathione hydrolase